MSRLVPNPIGDLKHPLQRIEDAVNALTGKLRPVDSLPSVHEELIAVNRTLTLVHETLVGMRADLARLDGAAPAPAPATRPAPKRARAAS